MLKVASLLPLLLAIGHFSSLVSAECCSVGPQKCNPLKPDEENYMGCADCTRGTPYCGYERCNIFGCNCGGGCRKKSNPPPTGNTSNPGIDLLTAVVPRKVQIQTQLSPAAY